MDPKLTLYSSIRFESCYAGVSPSAYQSIATRCCPNTTCYSLAIASSLVWYQFRATKTLGWQLGQASSKTMFKSTAISLIVILFTHPFSLNTASLGTHNLLTITSATEDATHTVLNFLRWYKTNIGAISKIFLVNQQPGKNYSVNSKNGEHYLTYLKSSHLLTAKYLNSWRTYFKERQAGFQANPRMKGHPLALSMIW